MLFQIELSNKPNCNLNSSLLYTRLLFKDHYLKIGQKIFSSERYFQKTNKRIRLYYYRTRAIISRSFYNFYPIFSLRFIFKSTNVTDNLCTIQGNSSKESAVYNQERFQIKSRLLFETNVTKVLSIFH